MRPSQAPPTTDSRTHSTVTCTHTRAHAHTHTALCSCHLHCKVGKTRVCTKASGPSFEQLDFPECPDCPHTHTHTPSHTGSHTLTHPEPLWRQGFHPGHCQSRSIEGKVHYEKNFCGFVLNPFQPPVTKLANCSIPLCHIVSLSFVQYFSQYFTDHAL